MRFPTIRVAVLLAALAALALLAASRLGAQVVGET